MSNKKSSFHEWIKTGFVYGERIDNQLAKLYIYYSMLARTRFKWTNLPKGIESRHIEDALFYNGQAFLFKDEDGYKCLPCSNTSSLNVYGDPLEVIVNGVGYQKIMRVDEGVIIRDNADTLPIMYLIENEIEKIYEIDKSIIANIRQQKFPFIIPCTKKNELTMKNIYAKFRDEDDFIVVDESMENNGDIGIKVMKTDAPFVADKLSDERIKIESDLLTKLGMNNTSVSKKERVVTSEIDTNNSEILFNLEMYYLERDFSKNKANDKFGLSMGVEKVIDTLNVDFTGNMKNKEGENIG